MPTVFCAVLPKYACFIITRAFSVFSGHLSGQSYVKCAWGKMLLLNDIIVIIYLFYNLILKITYLLTYYMFVL